MTSLSDLLFTQGFGTRRDCDLLAQSGLAQMAVRPPGDSDTGGPAEGTVLIVRGERWPVHETALVMLHKPAGYECSQKPRHHPSVQSLLPAPLRRRGVQPIGRLDEDTTGLLLLTDDGGLIHRLTSPRHHVPKVYEVRARHPVSAQQIGRLLAGVLLDDAPGPVRAAACEPTGEHSLRLTLTQGKYHQVKRMLAAVGNRVERLHRSRFGALALPDDLAVGQWRWVEADERAALIGSGSGASTGSCVSTARPDGPPR